MTPVPPFVPHAASVSERSAKGLIVLQTFVVTRLNGDNYFEIILAPDTGPNAARVVLVTKDEAAYEFALELEGKATRVDATWHHARSGSHRYCVLDTLQGPAA